MAVVLDPGTAITSYGGQDAEAYADYTWVASYITSNKVEFSAWTNASTEQRVAAILQATRDIDSRIYRGVKFYAYQRLKFPMVDDYIPAGITYNYSSYPELYWQEQSVKAACAEQALWILRNSGRDLHLERQALGIRSVSEGIGKISESYSYTGAHVGLCPEAIALLRKYFGYPKLVRS